LHSQLIAIIIAFATIFIIRENEPSMRSPLCKLADVPESGTAKIDFFGREAIVYRVAGQPRAVVNTCTNWVDRWT
jgi:hypothetical protein